MTVPAGGEEAWGISSMYVNTLWKGVKRWRQTLLHGAQWQSIRCYVHIESLPNHKETPFLYMWLGNHWNRFPRGVVVLLSLDAQNWVSCGPVQSSFDDFVSNWEASWGQVEDRCGLEDRWKLWIRFPEAIPSNVNDYVKLRAKGFTFFQYSVFQLPQ